MRRPQAILPIRRFAVFACLVTLGCVAAPRPLDVVPGARLRAVDAAALSGVLERNVSGGVVDYPGLCAEPGLPSLFAALGALDLTASSPSERLSASINGYNLLAAAAILEGGDPGSLFGRYGFFMRTRHAFAGEAITLWDLEHERIRPLGEPRIHFALVCASASCPKLASVAYSPEAGELERQLEAATREFINDPTRNRFDLGSGVASVSAIFDWYREDFETPDVSLAEYIADHVDSAAVARALREGTLTLRFEPYDWSLNGISPGPTGCPARQ